MKQFCRFCKCRGKKQILLCLACGRTPERSETCGSLKLNTSAKRTFNSAGSARPDKKQKSHSRLRNPVFRAATNPHLFEVRRLKHCAERSSGHCPASSPHTAPSHSLGILYATKATQCNKETNEQTANRYISGGKAVCPRTKIPKNENRRRYNALRRFLLNFTQKR